MSSNAIPTNFDCIILGTGLTNSILAAACSRIGKSVLHVDENNYYGDKWASFTFQQLIDWIKVGQPNDPSLQSIPDELVTKSRLFCIDLCPKLLYSNGAMVDLLVKSNVSRYHEFKNNIRILSLVGDQIHVMPCRRSDVFTSPLLSDLVDKRRLMKFIEICVKFEPDKDTPETSEIASNALKPIGVFLDERGLKYPLTEYIINSIAMVSPTDSTMKACTNIKSFMIATERFGRSPFLFPLYGCGEFPQSFCRLSAVFGGVYCLNTKVANVTTTASRASDSSTDVGSSSSGEKFAVQFSDNQPVVKSDMLVTDHARAVELNLTEVAEKPEDRLSRAILITRKSITPNIENLVSFMRIPPGDGAAANTVYLLEFNSSVMVCPPDLNIVYLWTRSQGQSNSAQQDLGSTIERVFRENTSEIVWKFYYHQSIGPQMGVIDGNGLEGLHITSPPCDDIDYGHSINEAERIFRKMCPDQDFLPRAPDPDEIIN